MLRKLGLLSVLFISVTCAGARADLISYHPFEEGSGTTTTDATGNGNNGTFNGSVQWVTGLRGGAVRLDTAGERIQIGKINPSGANNAMTLAAWINWEGSGHATITHQGIFGKRQGWTAPGETVKWFWEAQPDDDLAFRTYSSTVTVTDALANYKNEWAHVAVSWDNGTLIHYINGVQIHKGSITFNDTSNDVIVTIGCVSATNSESFVGAIDEARIYDTALTTVELAQAMTGDRSAATMPQPAIGATDVVRDVVLSWSPGEFAATHDIYFGASFDDVNAAGRADGRSVLVSQGQTEISYDPEGLLEFGKVYYWRVDEVNAAPDNTIARGKIWSFTAEPYGYPVATVTATASSSQPNMGPENTVNRSGLDANDEHSANEAQMWMSEGALPNWIQYEFDAVYPLHELWVWNSNQLIEKFIGFGARNVTIEYSLDGAAWTALEGVPEFAQAPGLPTTPVTIVVDFGGVMAKFVKLTINSNWSGVAPQVGLSEVRFSYAPVQARAPQPTAGATNVSLDAELNWRPGRQAVSHTVYFGADSNAVADGVVAGQSVTDNSYTPGSLTFGNTYYWKVDEVGETSTHAGDVWRFTTQEYTAIDDMESYNDDDNRIYESWIDGVTTAASGSIIGYMQEPFAERTILHGGLQSMPFEYNNVNPPFYSEAEREFETAQNWTGSGADTLSVWLRGNPVAFVEEAGTITMGASGTDIWGTADDFRFAYKTLDGDGSVIVKVESLANSNNWAKAGVMIRQSLDADSPFVYFIQSFAQGVSLGWRPTKAATCGSATQAGITAPQWVKLTRKGDIFTAQYSVDGATWTDLKATDGTIASTTVAMTNPVYIGLCVTSHNRNGGTTAVMSGAATTGNVTGGSWQALAIGDDPQPINAPGSLYVTVEDSTGKKATATSATAATSGIWTQWRIPFSSLTGINLTKVKKMYIGVDNRTSPSKGAGMLFIDDIGFGHPAQ